MDKSFGLMAKQKSKIRRAVFYNLTALVGGSILDFTQFLMFYLCILRQKKKQKKAEERRFKEKAVEMVSGIMYNNFQ